MAERAGSIRYRGEECRNKPFLRSSGEARSTSWPQHLIQSTVEGIVPRMPGMVLLQGTLDFLVLKALSHGPLHGYDVARFIRDGSDGTFRILDGALYTSLHRLEERGL